jgi:hypothetical protein
MKSLESGDGTHWVDGRRFSARLGRYNKHVIIVPCHEIGPFTCPGEKHRDDAIAAIQERF